MTIGFSTGIFGQSKATLSQPVYEGKVKVTQRYVPMRDGVELALRITRPDAEGKFPAIMEYNPYRRVKPSLADYRDEYPPAVPGPRVDTRPIYLKWFDYWLKGIDNGVVEEPPVTVYVRKYAPPASRIPLEEPGFWRSEAEWPIARAVPTRLYFREDGKLSREPFPGSDEAADNYGYKPTVGVTSGMHWGGGILPWAMPIDQRPDEAYSLTYVVKRPDSEIEVRANEVTSSDKAAFHHVVEVEVTVNGARHFQKSWSVTVPRRLN